MFTSCALFFAPSADHQAKIVLCVMQQNYSYDQCINDLQLDRNNIHDCMNGTLGTILQLFAEKESLLVLDNIQRVPAVTFNDVIDPSDSEMAIEKFCELLMSKSLAANRDFLTN